MNVELLERFVSDTARDAGHPFTLDGEAVTAGDLGDPKCLLPLVVATMQGVFSETRGQRPSTHTTLKQANPFTHMLGWEIQDLPSMPQGAMLLFANYVVREHLAKAPSSSIYYAALASTAPEPASFELRPHLIAQGLHAFPSATNAESAPGR